MWRNLSKIFRSFGKKLTPTSSAARWPGDLSVDERLQQAKSKTELLVGHALQLMSIHEANRIAVYSDVLSSQIPRSRAAVAFNLFVEMSIKAGLIQLSAIWDDPAEAGENIRTVISLVNDPGVKAALHAEYLRSNAYKDIRLYTDNLDPNCISTATKEAEAGGLRIAAEEAKKSIDRLERAIERAKNTVGLNELRKLRNLRHKRIAHLFTETNEEKRHGQPIDPPKYPEVESLMDMTISIVDDLNISIRGAAFMWDDSRELAIRRAKALWHGCRIEVLE